MENVDAGTILLVVVGCGVLCVIGVGLLFSLQILTSIVGAFANVAEVLGAVLSGGPLAWCGCILLFVICGAVILLSIWLVSILSTCGTADAVNLCRLLGAGG
jgi:hypothetical protein